MDRITPLFKRVVRLFPAALRARILDKTFAFFVHFRWLFWGLGTAKTQDLSPSLAISLTSYPKRFPKLHLTLKTLLTQSVRADHVILWIAHSDMAELPASVLGLRKYGLEIRTCDDLRSYKKIVPLLASGFTGHIVTADDDVYYPVDWLKELVNEAKVQGGKNTVFFHRGHKISLDDRKRPKPYKLWTPVLTPGVASNMYFPTGVGGVLYPPDVFDPRVVDAALFQECCPDTDDIWLFLMARLRGAKWQKVGHRFHFRSWLGTQEFGLRVENVENNRNDTQFQAAMLLLGFDFGDGH